MAIINPRQVDHMRKMQPTFRFKERAIAEALGPPMTNLAVALSSEPPIMTPLEITATASTPAAEAALSSVPVPTLASVPAIELLSIPDTVGESAPVVAPLTLPSVLSVDNKMGSMFSGDKIFPSLTPADQQLLDRAKWLVERFAVKYEEPKAEDETTVVDEFGDSDGGVGKQDNQEKARRGSRVIPKVLPAIVAFEGVTTQLNTGVETPKSASRPTSKHKKSSLLRDSKAAQLASSMLISFIDFLESGDVSLFKADDRRSWTRFILQEVRDEERVKGNTSVQGNHVSVGLGGIVGSETGGGSKEGGTVSDTVGTVTSTGTGILNDSILVNLDNVQGNITGVHKTTVLIPGPVEGEAGKDATGKDGQSWRVALMQVSRTQGVQSSVYV